MKAGSNQRPLLKAGIFLGIGLGGFFDGILFHQILQTHAMLSAKFPKTTIENIEINMFWDGLFHSVTYIMTLVGVILLWRAGRRTDVPWSGKTVVGAAFFGWGLFNFVEGIIDHHIFHLHHVVEAKGVSAFDYAFLASGVLFMVAGWMAVRSARHDGGSARGLERQGS